MEKKLSIRVCFSTQFPKTNKYCFINGPFYCYIVQSMNNLYKDGKKEGRTFLFNDALNTFYLRLYGVRHIVNDHSDSKRGGKSLPPHGLLFQISRKCTFIRTIPHTGQHIPRTLLHQSVG